jgi:hypothetical protein
MSSEAGTQHRYEYPAHSFLSTTRLPVRDIGWGANNKDLQLDYKRPQIPKKTAKIIDEIHGSRHITSQRINRDRVPKDITER